MVEKSGPFSSQAFPLPTPTAPFSPSFSTLATVETAVFQWLGKT